MTFIPYGKQSINQADIDAVTQTLHSDYLTTGTQVAKFEQALALYCEANYCVVVSNGTAALHLASLVLLNRGDKVLTTPNSFLATANVILYAAAIPIFIDIAQDGNIDLDLCEIALKKDPTIKALYAVAFSGNMLNQQKLQHLKQTYHITILEDCAHAIGASSNQIKAGSCTHSDMSIFSFHPVKHITSAEGGAITTNSLESYNQLLSLRNHGIIKTAEMQPWEYQMQTLGFNYRLTDIQCALGLSQLNQLDHFIDRRMQIAQRYDQAFAHSLIQPLYHCDGQSSYHLYVVQVDFNPLTLSKAALFQRLNSKNIGIQLHYMPINKQPYYQTLGYGQEQTPMMDIYYQNCFSLPMYPKLTDQQQTYVIKTLFELLNA